jgi:hypothetical protein
VLGRISKCQLLPDMERLVLLLSDTGLEPSFERVGGFRLLIERREPALRPGLHPYPQARFAARHPR